jgi:hypothetical protein
MMDKVELATRLRAFNDMLAHADGLSLKPNAPNEVETIQITATESMLLQFALLKAAEALTAAEPFFEPGTTLNECIAELGDDEPFVVQHGPDGWEVRKMTAWKVLNPEVFADVRPGLEAAIRAAELALFVIRKQNVMPNSSWESGFNSDLAQAKAALAALSDPPVLDEVVG